MTSNKASTSDMPSPMFTYATTYTVPRSLPVLSISSTPFYPQSQHHMHDSRWDAPGSRDAGCCASPQEFNDAHKSHVNEWSRPRDSYNQQCYTSSGSDPFKASWVANHGNVWGGNSLSEDYLYAADALVDSYQPPDFQSYYYAESGLEQNFHAGSSSSTAFVAAVYPDPGASSFNALQSGAQSVQQASCFSKVKEHVSSSLKNSLIQDQAGTFCAIRKEAPTKNISSETAKTFSSCKPDGRPFSMQVSSEICASFGITSQTAEPKIKQALTDMTENRGAQRDRSNLFKESCCSSGDEHGSLESAELKHSIPATLNSANKLESRKGSNLDAPTMSISNEVNQKEADNSSSLLPQSSSSQLLSTSGQCSGMISPKHIHAQSRHSSIIENEPLEQRDIGSLLSRPPSLIRGMGDRQCVEAIDQEGKMGSSDVTGPQLLVKSIHDLSKALLSCQSGMFSNVLDPKDCFAIEHTICILSQRLHQSFINEGNFCQDHNCHQLQDAEQGLNISEDKLNEESSREVQQKESFLLEGMNPKVKTVSPSGFLKNGALDGSVKLTSNTCAEGNERAEQSSFWKKELRKSLEDVLILQCNFAKLQEEVAYERAESNATVTTYKKLWSEAQEALNVSRLEIADLKAEQAGLKQHFTNLKHSEGLDGLGADPELTKYNMKTCCNNLGCRCENLLDRKTGSSCQNSTGQNVYSEARSKKPFPARSEVYFVPESISSHRENLSSCVKGEGTALSHINQSGKLSEGSAVEPLVKRVGGAYIQDEVKQRLSLLLARQCLDLNKMDSDRDVKLPASLSTSLEASSNLPRGSEALPSDKKGNHLIWSETSYMENINKKVGGAKADWSCQVMPSFDDNCGDCSLVQTQSNNRDTEGMDFEGVDMSTFQEDEIEIICFKPGVAESSLTSLKEELEWEHVVVNGLDNHKTTQ